MTKKPPTKKRRVIKKITKTVIENKPALEPIPEMKPQTNDLLEDISKDEPKLEVVKAPEVITKDADSLLDDMLQPKDKDSDANYLDDVDDPISENYGEDKPVTDKPKENVSAEGESKFEKIKRAIDNPEDIDNYDDPKIRKAECKLSAMIMVEAFTIGLSFTGQIISGYWDNEHEKKYTLSDERRNNLIRPLAKYFELQNKKRNPMGALIVAMIVSVITIVLGALSDRKQRLKIEALENKNNEGQNEIVRLRTEFEKQKIETERAEYQYNQSLNKKFTIPAGTVKKIKTSDLICTCGKPKGQKGRHKPTCQTVTGR